MTQIQTKQSILKLIKEAEAQFSGTGKSLLDIEDYVAEYLTANGVIVPPCKVGQTVYVVSRYFKGVWYLHECKVDEITMYQKNTFIRMKSIDNYTFAEEVSQIGRCVFFTCEEAEKALAERSKE